MLVQYAFGIVIKLHLESIAAILDIAVRTDVEFLRRRDEIPGNKR
jgi:hypothetical protein